MANQVCNFSDLIHRFTASCSLHPLAQELELKGNSENPAEDEEYEEDQEESSNEENDDKRKGERRDFRVSGEKKVMEMEILMGEMFDSVSSLKRAYINLQEAHHPWNPEKLRLADVAMVAELKRLGCLKERFRRRAKGGGKSNIGPIPLCEVVAPYEASMEDLKREIRAKDVELETLKEKLHNVSNFGKKGRTQSKRKINCNQNQVAALPSPEMFEAMMSQVKEASKSFTSHLLSLMRSSRWDLTATVRSIEAASGSGETDETTAAIVGAHHAKYALESYIYRKIFHGFDHETFYMDGSLSSLLNPDQFRRNCFTQYRDMKAMNPTELLGILPTCHFGKFCSTKFISILHEKMEESLFGNLEQRRQILAGNHPRSQFYGEFLTLAKAVWLLHLLAFALDPAPSHFQAVRGGAFQADRMESVVRFSGGRVPVGQIVGFPISPGFKLGNGSVIKSRVYLVSRD